MTLDKLLHARGLRITALALATLSLAACGDPKLVSACTYEDSAFDIDQVSTLEDAFASASIHDAVVIDFNTAKLPPGGTWRVRAVDVLMMIPKSQFATFNKTVRLGVEVVDATAPTTAAPFTLWQTLDKNALTWEQVTLTNPTEATETTQMKAWWTFDFGAVIPQTGMKSPTFVAGVVWNGDANIPAIGYSNYNRPCAKNWTDYGDGLGWKLNSGTGSPNECNWPMMRVRTEITDPSGNCK